MLAVTVVGATLCVVFLLIPLYSALLARSTARAAADAAALAAADVAIGIAAGSPCPVAATVAHAHRASITKCVVDGVMVTVRVSIVAGGVPVTATATAGPPNRGAHMGN